MSLSDPERVRQELLTTRAVRTRAGQVHAAARAGRTQHFALHDDRLPALADYVIDTIRQNYPDLEVPFHARWRHIAAGGVDRWAAIDAVAEFEDSAARGRAAFDLAITSVLLDAGAGPDWRYHEGATGQTFARSEGLAVASVAMFTAGHFSTRPTEPFRADSAALMTLSAEDVGTAFQVSGANPLVGLGGRAALLNALGRAAEGAPHVFAIADDPRPGGLFDWLAGAADGGRLPARRIVEAVISHLGPIWPSRLSLAGVALGDTWRHPAVLTDDLTSGFIPFHKLSQWLSYSLIEPLEWAGLTVTDIDDLTGLPEYRNGGLFLDGGALTLKDPAQAAIAHEPGSELIVEWRALTVALLDEIAGLIRTRLGLSAENFPLAKVLEGGTWAAGRRIAREKRADGGPPLSILSDGTVF
jgi:hypothetical protein